MKREGPIIAWQLQEQLENDQEYQAMMREKRKRREEFERILAEDQK